jgi:hypothetical protein
VSSASPTTPAQVPAQSVVSAPVQPAIPVIKVSDWLNKLDDRNPNSDCALNADPFLDLAGYLKTLPPSDDPQKVFNALYEPAAKLVKAQNVIDQMLKQQAGKR